MKHLWLCLVLVLVLSACASTGAWEPRSGSAPVVDSADAAVVYADVAGVGMPGDGNVLALGLMETLRYLRLVVADAPSTFIMQGPNGEYFLAWAIRSGTWGFMSIDSAGAPLTNLRTFSGSNYSNTMTFTDLVKHLQTNGWSYITASGLPAWFVSSLSSGMAFVTQFSAYIPMPMLVLIPGPMEYRLLQGDGDGDGDSDGEAVWYQGQN